MVTLDLDRAEVRVGRREIHLGTKEFDILSFLMGRKGFVSSRADILRVVWSDGKPNPRYVDQYISRIRRKLGKDGRMIRTVSGKGYRFVT